MSKKLMAAALVLGVSMLPVAAIAGGWGAVAAGIGQQRWRLGAARRA